MGTDFFKKNYIRYKKRLNYRKYRNYTENLIKKVFKKFKINLNYFS